MSGILVGVAARNEAEGLKHVLPLMPTYSHGMPVSVLVIDDGSTDNTADVARYHGAEVFSYAVSAGNGRARKQTFLHAHKHGYLYAITMDGDGQHRPDHIHQMIAALEAGASFAKASRYHPVALRNCDELPPRWLERNREVTERFNELTRWQLTDALCGMTAMRPDLAVQVIKNIGADDYAYELELLKALAQIVSWDSVAEVPHPPVYALNDTMRAFYHGDLTAREQRYDRHLEQLAQFGNQPAWVAGL